MENARVSQGADEGNDNLSNEIHGADTAESERRRAPRVACDRWVRVSFEDQDSIRHSMPALCTDVSDTGCRLVVSREIPVGPLTVYLDKDKGSFLGEVVYCKASADSDELYVAGCKILQPAPPAPSRRVSRPQAVTC